MQYRSTHQLRFDHNNRSRKIIKFLNGAFQGKFKKGSTKKDAHHHGKKDMNLKEHENKDKKSDSDETKKKKTEGDPHHKQDDSDRVSLQHRDPVPPKSLTRQTEQVFFPRPIDHNLKKAQETERFLREQKEILEQNLLEVREEQKELEREEKLAKIEELEERLKQVEEALKEEEETIRVEEEKIRVQEEEDKLAGKTATREATAAAGVPLPEASSTSMATSEPEPIPGQMIDCKESACSVECKEELPLQVSKPCRCKEKCKRKFGVHIEDNEDFTAVSNIKPRSYFINLGILTTTIILNTPATFAF